MSSSNSASPPANAAVPENGTESVVSCDDRDWQVPTFTITELAPKQHDYCVVIPVINEGERIGRLLQKMKVLNISSIADIIIVDGGSKDGSLAQEKLTATSVRTLLIKTGPGKLSAQLRCAYAYSLRQGYTGIVTIDGNDKDDPDAIGGIIGELRKGADFVQGSRFVPGGVAENTPLSRWIAIRLVHAPLLSLASRFYWTDTTQGFRGYSRRLLLDERVQPFRDVFTSYELLAYLSCIAPRLGFRCLEYPTARRYPANEKTPTKISAVSGNWQVMKTLLKACFRRFDV